MARLVALTPYAERLESVQPPPPWVGWNHAGKELWPVRDDGADLNEAVGPAWLDGAAERAALRSAR